MAKSIMSMSEQKEVWKKSTEMCSHVVQKEEEMKKNTENYSISFVTPRNINAMSNELLESILIQRYEQLKHEYWWSFENCEIQEK